MIKAVVDTNVFVSALRSGGGASRQVIRKALLMEFIPVFGNALWLEYEDLLSRDIWTDFSTDAERKQILAALASVGSWFNIYYGWRPNLRDEGDNHLIELAIAAQASIIISYNTKDLTHGQLVWPYLKILTPSQFLELL